MSETEANQHIYNDEYYENRKKSLPLEQQVIPKIAEAVKELEQLAKEMIDECLVDDDVSGGYTPDPEGTWINKLYAVINKLDTKSNFSV